MPKTLALIHTSPVLIPMFAQLAKQYLGGVEVFHVVDESLIKNTIATGGLSKNTVRRVVQQVGSAHDGGAEAVLVTCSSIGAAVPVARAMFDFPVFRIDEAMAEKAVESGRRIGVAATLRTTLEPTIALLRDTAAARGREVEIIPSLAEGAFEAVLAGDTAKHDTLLKSALTALLQEVDVVVLAQASMVRVLASMNLDGGPPVLSSPELAIQRVRDLMIGPAA